MRTQPILAITAFLFSALAAAAPYPLSARDSCQEACQAIQQIMPTSNTCSGAQFPDECTTAAAAAQPLIDAMQRWAITNAGQIAAVLSLIGFESVDMKFKHNVSPGRVGQGTSNMQMINYNREYAAALTDLPRPLPADDGALLALLMDDKYNFGSGPWFLMNKCSKDVQNGLMAATDDAFKAYMGCVGVDASSDRLAYWTRAKKAFAL